MKFGWRNRVKWIAPTVGVAAIALSLSLGVPDTGCGGVITSITPIDDEASEHLTGSKRCSVPNSLKPLKFDSPTAATFVEMTPIELRVSSPMGATIARVDNALKKYPGSDLEPEALVLKAETLLKMNEEAKAREVLQRVVDDYGGPFAVTAKKFLAEIDARPKSTGKAGQGS